MSSVNASSFEISSLKIEEGEPKEDCSKKDECSNDIEIFNPSKSIKSLMNKKFLSDVTFIVGQKVKKFIYGHKTFLALASPVFERMFYGDFLQSPDQIVDITDVSSVGFLNVLKYIYGYGIEIQIDELYETYYAGDKYLVTGLKNNLLSYTQQILNNSNLIIIYEQLLNLEEKEIFDLVKASISINCSSVFNNESFLQIDQITLINLLNLNYLNMSEIDILNCCLNWCEYKYDAYKYNDSKKDLIGFFDLIKNHIKFDELTIDDIKRSKLAKFLNTNELGKILINLIFEQKHDAIECLTKRLTVNPFKLSNIDRSILKVSLLFVSNTLLKSDRKIFIKSILTSIYIDGKELTCKDINFSVHKIDDNKLKLSNFKVKDEEKIIDDQRYLNICFTPYLEIEPEITYSFNLSPLKQSNKDMSFYSNANLILEENDYKIKINLTSEDNQFNFFKSISFYPDF